MQLQGKKAIITGGARGIGGATATLFVREGAEVVITDVLTKDGEAKAKELGDAAHYLKHDVTQQDQWDKVVKESVSLMGTIDILVNNAGFGGTHFEVLETMPMDVVRKIMDINFMGTVMGIKAVAPTMIKAKSGSIVNISSTSAQQVMNSLAIYSASKAAIGAVTKAVSMELGPHNIRVNSIHPGGANTKMGNQAGLPLEQFSKNFGHAPAQRGCEPEEIAAGVLFFASDASSYCMGSELLLDGGQASGLYLDYLPGHPNMPHNKLPTP